MVPFSPSYLSKHWEDYTITASSPLMKSIESSSFTIPNSIQQEDKQVNYDHWVHPVPFACLSHHLSPSISLGVNQYMPGTTSRFHDQQCLSGTQSWLQASLRLWICLSLYHMPVLLCLSRTYQSLCLACSITPKWSESLLVPWATWVPGHPRYSVALLSRLKFPLATLHQFVVHLSLCSALQASPTPPKVSTWCLVSSTGPSESLSGAPHHSWLV